MKISQALKLGHQSIMGHKRRNLTTITIIGLLFGLLSGIIFTTQGTENAILRAANETLGESYYVSLMTNFYKKDCRQEAIPDQPNSFNIICPEDTATKSAQLVDQYGGEIVSQGSTYTRIITPSQLPQFVSADLDRVPADAIAVLAGPDALSPYLNVGYFTQMPLARRAEFVLTQLPEAVGATVETTNRGGDRWYVAGILPSGSITHIKDTPGQSFNPFDMILDFLGMSSNSGQPLIYLDVDSPATQEGIAALREQNTIAENMTYILAKFSDPSTALKFVDREVCGNNISGCNKLFLLDSGFDNRIGLHESSRIAWGILDIVETIIIAIAAVIMFFTFIKVLGDQTAQIRLYRSLGASTADICLIYGAYLLEVCLYAIGFMLILGLVIAGLTSLLNAAAFSDILTAAYNRVFAWPKLLIGWNSDLIKFSIAMLVVAALSLLWFLLTKKHAR